MALDGLAVGLLGLEGRRCCCCCCGCGCGCCCCCCCSVSVWESEEEESEAWASAVCSLSLARGSAHRLPGDLTCVSGAESGLTCLWRGKGQCERGGEGLMGVCQQLTPADTEHRFGILCSRAHAHLQIHAQSSMRNQTHAHRMHTPLHNPSCRVTYGPVPERLGVPLLMLG